MKIPAISIICPVYQAEHYLQRCADSILSQTFSDYELILIDDGSTDSSPVICDEYAKKDSRIRVVHQSNGGVCKARQAGLDLAQGEYTIHVDPDDWVEPQYLYLLYSKANECDADIVLCDFFQNSEGNQLYIKQQPSSLDSSSLLHDMFHHLHACCWNKLVRRATYQKRNIRFPENLTIWEDLAFNVTLCMEPLRVAYVNEALYHYDVSINEHSLVRVGNQQTLDSQKWVIQYFEQHNVSYMLLNELKIMTKERAFLLPTQTGAGVVSLYPEVNELYKGMRSYANPLWRAIACTLQFPQLYSVIKLIFSIELGIKGRIHALLG